MKKLFSVSAWLLLATGCILISIASLDFYYLTKPNQATAVEPAPVQISAAQDATGSDQVKGVSTVMESDDGRAEIVAKFLERYNSPLKPYEYYGQKLVEIADKYELDFRFLPAIAMQESNLCKKAPPDTYNCLGFGIHERGTLGFASYEEGFERAARELRAYYVDQGRLTTEDIMRKYTPKSDGSWAASVNQWMAEMRYDDRAKGKALKTNTNVLEFAKTDENSSATEEASNSATPG